MYQEIIYEVDDSVAVITMNRPKTLNALTDRTQAEIRHALDQSERNEAVIGSVLTGAGRGFCSGVDMNALGAMSEAGQRLGEKYASLVANPGNPDDDQNFKIGLAYFLGLRKPLIAAINGACAGLGFSYAVFCDLRFVDRTARFVTSFSQRGLIAEHGVSWMLPRQRARYPLDRTEARRRRGRTHRARQPRMRTRGVCQRCEDLSSRNRQDGGAQVTHDDEEADLPTSQCRSSRGDGRVCRLDDQSLAHDDFKEGVASFAERRSPNFSRITVD